MNSIYNSIPLNIVLIENIDIVIVISGHRMAEVIDEAGHWLIYFGSDIERTGSRWEDCRLFLIGLHVQVWRMWWDLGVAVRDEVFLLRTVSRGDFELLLLGCSDSISFSQLIMCLVKGKGIQVSNLLLIGLGHLMRMSGFDRKGRSSFVERGVGVGRGLRVARV